MKYRYHFEDLRDSSNSCILRYMTQLIEKTGMSYRKIQGIFNVGDVYYDSRGRFKISKLVYEEK